MAEPAVVAMDDHLTQRSCRRSDRALQVAPNERSLLDAVRCGDSDAYGQLYALHHDAVQRLARRLCRDRHEADDVVSEVFCNTLRAIDAGHGPRDEARAYLLRSVRSTVIKLRTRKDSGRATPVADDELDSGVEDDVTFLTGTATGALRDVSPRFREVLWSVEVRGYDTADIAESEHLAPPAAASLVHRARRALRRSYLRNCVNAPVAGRDCTAIRSLLPVLLDGELSAANAIRLQTHLDGCAACCTAHDEMGAMRARLANRAWLLVVPSLLRAMATDGARIAATFAAGTPTAMMLVAMTGAALTGVAVPDPIVPPPSAVVAMPAGVAPAAATAGAVFGQGSNAVPDRPADATTSGGAVGATSATVPVASTVDASAQVDLPPGAPPIVLDPGLAPLVDGVVTPVIEHVAVPVVDLAGDALVGLGDTTDRVLDDVGRTVGAATTDVADVTLGERGLVDGVAGDIPLVDGLTDVLHHGTVELGHTLDEAVTAVNLLPTAQALEATLAPAVGQGQTPG